MTTTIAIVPDPSRAELRLNMEAQAYDHKVALDNTRFEKASPARKRVIIAKDVLKWLEAGKLLPTSGVYLSPFLRSSNGDYQYNDYGEVVSGRVLSDRVDGGKCSACALGAVFACAVERQGGLKGFWNNHSSRMQEHLKPFFDQQQLEAIEAAFERNSGFVCTGDNKGKLGEKAEAFGRAVWRDAVGEPMERSRAVMEAIMRNIIANKGTFIP